ncbi:MAG: hypothetical protein IJX22_06910, partial [Opitutales bacterium]|nr:hypothetical protein [Opitutales bacterium]
RYLASKTAERHPGKSNNIKINKKIDFTKRIARIPLTVLRDCTLEAKRFKVRDISGAYTLEI